MPVEDQFAPGQFIDMSDAEKVSRRSFEPFEAGVEAQSSAAPQADFVRNIVVEHEVIYLRKPRLRLIHRIGRLIFDVLLRGSAVAVSPLGKERLIPTGLGTAPVSMSTGGFVVANTNDLQLHETTIFRSEAAAVQAMKSVVAGKPELKGKLQVVSSSNWRRDGKRRIFISALAAARHRERDLRAGIVCSRATVRVSATASDGVDTAGSAPHAFELLGPGDVIGVDPQNIVRSEPRNWVTDFEPNFLPFVEFYEEDFPWRYSPVGPEAGPHRLLPWLTLLVVEEGEFERNNAPGGR